MSLSFGGGQKSKPPTDVRRARKLLLGSIFGDPFLEQIPTKGDAGEVRNILGGRSPITADIGTLFTGGQDFSGSPFIGFDPTVNQGQFPGFGGVPDLTQGSVGQLLQQNPSLALTNVRGGTTAPPTGAPLLPTLGQLGTFNTVFEKADLGLLSPTANAVIGTALNAITQPISAQSSQAINSILSTPAPGKLPDPPNIGELTTNIFNSLPSEFKEFTQNLLEDSTPEAMERELDNLSQKLSEQAQLDAESTGGKLLSVFAAQGATGGSALEASKELAVEVTTRTNTVIAQARLNALDTLGKSKRARSTDYKLLTTSWCTGTGQHCKAEGS